MSTTLGFDRIYYFGDSLTDSDEIFAASSAVAFFGIPPLAAGYAGQFSNGDVYADLVPDLIGVEGGEALNYAVGGAQALTDRTIQEILPPQIIRPDARAEDLAFGVDYQAQVDRFLADTAGEDLSDAAVSVLIGLNDFGDVDPLSLITAQDPVQVAFLWGAQIAQSTLESTVNFAIAGVGTIILNTVPESPVFPFNEQSPEVFQLLGPVVTAGYNTTLLAGVAALEAAGAEVVVVDYGAMLEEVDRNSDSFGFQLFDQQFLLGSQGSGGINPDFAAIPFNQVAFYDSVHPTAELHEIMAAFQAESLTSKVEIGTAADEDIKGTKGDDLVLGRDGNDDIALSNGDDVAIGGRGNDVIAGGNGNDLIDGSNGNDHLLGGNGNDILSDGTGTDVSKGGNGDDLLIDGAGSDMAFGGNGADAFIFTQAAVRGRDTDGMDYFDGGRGYDTLVLRLADVDMDLGITQQGSTTIYDALGLTTTSIEEVLIIGAADVPELDGFEDALATADLWHLV